MPINMKRSINTYVGLSFICSILTFTIYYMVRVPTIRWHSYGNQTKVKLSIEKGVCPKGRFSGQFEWSQYQRYQDVTSQGLDIYEQQVFPAYRQYGIHFGDCCLCSRQSEAKFTSPNSGSILLTQEQSPCQCYWDQSHSCYFPIRITELDQSANKSEDLSATNNAGGSNLYVEMTSCRSGGLWLCPVEDFFNGTYTAWCPLFSDLDQYQGSCLSIKVTLVYINMLAYKTNTKIKQIPLNITLVNQQVCNNLTTGVTVTPAFTPARPAMTGWIRKPKSNWIWVEKGVSLNPLNKTQIRNCIDRFSSITMIGSSHMRFFADHLMLVHDELPWKNIASCHQDLKTQHINYIYNKYADNMKKVLTLLKNDKRPKVKSDIIILMSGAWDMMLRNLNHYVYKSAPILVESVRYLNQETNWAGARFVMLKSVPISVYPKKHLLHPMDRRSLFSIAASNAWLEGQMTALNSSIEMFEDFQMLAPRSQEHVCGIHYMCRPEHKDHVIGQAGIDVWNNILYHICK